MYLNRTIKAGEAFKRCYNTIIHFCLVLTLDTDTLISDYILGLKNHSDFCVENFHSLQPIQQQSAIIQAYKTNFEKLPELFLANVLTIKNENTNNFISSCVNLSLANKNDKLTQLLVSQLDLNDWGEELFNKCVFQGNAYWLQHFLPYANKNFLQDSIIIHLKKQFNIDVLKELWKHKTSTFSLNHFLREVVYDPEANNDKIDVLNFVLPQITHIERNDCCFVLVCGFMRTNNMEMLDYCATQFSLKELEPFCTFSTQKYEPDLFIKWCDLTNPSQETLFTCLKTVVYHGKIQYLSHILSRIDDLESFWETEDITLTNDASHQMMNYIETLVQQKRLNRAIESIADPINPPLSNSKRKI